MTRTREQPQYQRRQSRISSAKHDIDRRDAPAAPPVFILFL